MRRHPRSTRPHTLFPHSALLRSAAAPSPCALRVVGAAQAAPLRSNRPDGHRDMTSRSRPNTDSTAADHRQTRARVVLVTGMSGAGRSSTLKVLEDLGYEAVDNLPLTLVCNLVRSDADAASERPRRPLAVGVDIRSEEHTPETQSQ